MLPNSLQDRVLNSSPKLYIDGGNSQAGRHLINYIEQDLGMYLCAAKLQVSKLLPRRTRQNILPIMGRRDKGQPQAQEGRTQDQGQKRPVAWRPTGRRDRDGHRSPQ